MNDETNVYILAQEMGDHTLFKVGIAANIATRIAQLKVGNPCELDLAFAVGFSSRRMAKMIEKEMHHYLAEYRISGEWFRCSYEKMVYALPCAIAVHKHHFGITNELDILKRLGYPTEGANGTHPHH